MYGKIQITGKIELVTGMHIGGSTQFAAIGAVDSPVIRDKQSDLPMIPGSSLKGKLRVLMAKLYADSPILGKHNDDPEIILRMFGSSDKDKVRNSRLIFSDMILANMEELKKQEIHSATEIKFENTINRMTAVANPRQIERTIRGSQFDLNLIYNIENEDQIEEDMEALRDGFRLLQYDYLGGHGSRGYGKVKVSGLMANAVVGKIDPSIIDRCNTLLADL